MHSKWDIVLASLPFREDPNKSKTRPCVIIDVDKTSNEYIIIGVSSASRRETDYQIKYYKQANLSNGSVIMIDHIVRVGSNGKFTYIGHLDKTDRVNVMRLMSN